MEIMRNHVISNRVIRYEKEPNRSILEENEQTRKKISSFTDVWSRSDAREVIESDILAIFG